MMPMRKHSAKKNRERRVSKPAREHRVNPDIPGLSFEIISATGKGGKFHGITRRKADLLRLKKLVKLVGKRTGAGYEPRIIWGNGKEFPGRKARYLVVHKNGKPVSLDELHGIFEELERIKRRIDRDKQW